MAIFSEEKVKKLFTDYIAELGSQVSAEQLEESLNLVKAHSVNDMIDLLSESEETKVNLKKDGTKQQNAINMVKQQLSQGIQEDVYLAAIQRYFELTLRLAKKENNFSEEKLKELEYFIAEIDKEELKDSTFSPQASPAPEIEKEVLQSIEASPAQVEVQEDKTQEVNQITIPTEAPVPTSSFSETPAPPIEQPKATDMDKSPFGGGDGSANTEPTLEVAT